MPVELETPDNLEYRFYLANSGFFQFRVRAPSDAHLALSPVPGTHRPMYEIIIGGWKNTKSVIRKNETKPDVCEAEIPGLLNEGEFCGFWVRWEHGNISVGREGEADPFLNWTDFEVVPIRYVGVSTGWGASGAWILDQVDGEAVAPSAPYIAAPVGSQSVCWVPASGGQVPPSAFSGGEDSGETMYVIRAVFNGGIVPGKLIQSHGVAYIPWGGAENAVSEYEVLCDFGGSWVACCGGDIPGNALPAGETEDGETLYVGRVVHDGALTVGKVHPTHGVVYIPYGGGELSFADYEILVQ